MIPRRLLLVLADVFYATARAAERPANALMDFHNSLAEAARKRRVEAEAEAEVAS